MTETTRPIPLLGDISLDAIQHIEHTLDAGFVPTRIVSLPGTLQQRAGRPSHQIQIASVLTGPEAKTQLETLQQAAATGAELTFAADIASALDLQKVVITGFRAQEVAGLPQLYQCQLSLAESPPLPPPAQVSGFGGLDDFGLGDLGFDTDILGDLADLAGEVAGAVDQALAAIDQLNALANLDGLSLNGVLAPMDNVVGNVGQIASSFTDAAQTLSSLFSP
ncbi:hypothetical protein [Nodosilinea sp. E11]|uniref:hypothetical protein n=1 Tax=Nodosilinea sp. E11 TaxID=3037479 RepID=UPI00293480FF|nr:hypothetical protein [Nodosilinea sp. E11]WOD39717.1 hypothetical protein RRF56_02770 [Nodosilinea sp. E11]